MGGHQDASVSAGIQDRDICPVSRLKRIELLPMVIQMHDAAVEIDGAALAAGQLELFCSVGDHQAKGMQALLEVG